MGNLIALPKIREIIDTTDHSTLISYIEKAFTSYSTEKAVVPPVGTLTFENPPADVHIKYGYIREDDYYVIKIASGFYDNPSRGLSSSNGLNLVFSQKTGELKTILLDEGYLTDIRTALAGAVVAKHLAPSKINCIGIVGTGIQARLQLKFLETVTDCRDVLVYGRSTKGLQSYFEEMQAGEFRIKKTQNSRDLSNSCQLIVTTTPAKEAVLFGDRLQPGTLITAIGADTKGKQELDIPLLTQANLIVADSISQCQSHGEIHKAYQQNLINDHPIIELGAIIADSSFIRDPDHIIVADLTGIATQDIQISKFALEHLT